MQKEKKSKLNCRMRLKSRWHPLSICQDHFQHKPRVTQIHKYTNTQMHKYQRHVCILGNLCPRRKTQYEVGNYFLVWGMYVWGMYVGEWAFWKLFSLLWPKYEINSTQIQEQWFGKYWGKTSLSDLKVKLWWGRSWIKGIKKMPDGNSSSDEELVVGNLFDDESGSDSSDESSSDEYESSSDEPLGPQPMFQGPQHLASDPRYIYVSVLRSSHFCQSHMTDNQTSLKCATTRPSVIDSEGPSSIIKSQNIRCFVAKPFLLRFTHSLGVEFQYFLSIEQIFYW